MCKNSRWSGDCHEWSPLKNTRYEEIWEETEYGKRVLYGHIEKCAICGEERKQEYVTGWIPKFEVG